jgi:hypothetical protein
MRGMTPSDPVPAEGVAKYPLRLPHGLYEALRETADQQGVSVNTLMATLLAGSIGWTLDQRAGDKQWVMR